MNREIIPLNAFGRDEVLSKGQAWFVKHVAQSGAYGIEIRRELFATEELPLAGIREEIEKSNLFTVYSAPIELWREDGSLNKIVLESTFAEAKVLGTNWLKVSLGHYQENGSDFVELKTFLPQYAPIELIVENDQTLYGGNVDRLASFFQGANQHDVPVKMTFDTGNWYYTGQNVERALAHLADYVGYLHLKHVEKHGDRLVTLPLPSDEDAEWGRIVRYFPEDLVKGLEFPLELNEIQTYINRIRHKTR